MKIIFLAVLLFFISVIGFSEVKEENFLSSLPFSSVVKSSGEEIYRNIPGIKDIKIVVKYELSDSKTTCTANINVSILIDEKSLKEIEIEKIEGIIKNSFLENSKDHILWALFFCKVENAIINYEIIKIVEIPKKESKDGNKIA